MTYRKWADTMCRDNTVMIQILYLQRQEGWHDLPKAILLSVGSGAMLAGSTACSDHALSSDRHGKGPIGQHGH